MRDWPAYGFGNIPTPELVAACAALDILAADLVPLWAAHWLVQGYDGEALRTLAGLSGNDRYDVEEILPAALADCAVAIPDSFLCAAQVVFTALARTNIHQRATERWIADIVSGIVRQSAYDDDVIDLPLGQIYILDVEWDEGWGRTEEQLIADIRAACRAQLADTN
jgi:hypothetical protein